MIKNGELLILNSIKTQGDDWIENICKQISAGTQ